MQCKTAPNSCSSQSLASSRLIVILYIHLHSQMCWYYISQVGIDMIGPLPLTIGKGTDILLPLWTTSASGQKQLPFLTRQQLEWLCFFMSCMSMILSHILILPILPIITCRFGCCEVIISDQRSKFVNKVKEELQQLTGTEHHVTSTYHAQSNRLTETFNQTLQTALIKVVNQWYTRWQLSSVLLTSNCPAEGNQDVTLIWGNVLQASASAYNILAIVDKIGYIFPYYAVTENQWKTTSWKN